MSKRWRVGVQPPDPSDPDYDRLIKERREKVRRQLRRDMPHLFRDDRWKWWQWAIVIVCPIVSVAIWAPIMFFFSVLFIAIVTGPR